MNKLHRYPINPLKWLEHIATSRSSKEVQLLQQGIDYYANKNTVLLDKGLSIADILFTLKLDTETLLSALLYPGLQAHVFLPEALSEKFGEECSQLLRDVLQMQSLGNLQNLSLRNHQQMENLRKMLLAMVGDVRAVLIVLAERLWQLRAAKQLEKPKQTQLAQETLEVYAPLTNRLGIWPLKWEIEDLCLRYLQPDIYRDIAKWLAVRRDEREIFIQQVMTMVTDILTTACIKSFQVHGRVKHIYSIYRKMQRKQVAREHIYDVTALRIVVAHIDDCYTVLGLIQNTWPQIQEEFDDYIALPKPNGYRSIHMVVIGPDNHLIEIQIRTQEMHHESELGVAAHWRYKEGVLQTSSYQAKIALLRQVMAWQQEMVDQGDSDKEKSTQDLFADRVYVFTPNGDIVDLPKGATPLDFAYTIHSEVGHRCRGAKVGGAIVPLTYHLQTGEQVEILTAKQANPSRDWANVQLGYLKTARARSSVLYWFRLHDSSSAPLPKEAEVKSHNAVLPPHKASNKREVIVPKAQVLGINNLLSNIARCCKPLPGDAIIGYITRTRGVSIHRRDCGNILNAARHHHVRIIEVNWGEKQTTTHPVDLVLRFYDRPGLLRDITTVLAADKINVSSLRSEKLHDSPEIDMYLTLDINNVVQLNKALSLLKHIPNVIEIRRR